MLILLSYKLRFHLQIYFYFFIAINDLSLFDRVCSSPPYSSFQTPTLVVYGSLDTNLGAQSHKNLIQLPNHSVLKLEGAGHVCYKDKPREFHQGLMEFLSKLK